MAFPKYKDIEIPLLQEIQKAGGQAKPRALYAKVAAHFPELTDDDKKEKIRTGVNKWENMVQWAREKLCKKGELSREPRGLWTITTQGIARAGQQPATPSQGLPSTLIINASAQPRGPDKIAEQIKDLVNNLLVLANKSEVAPVPGHDELIKMGREMGEKLGKKVDTETGPVYKHDVSWKDNPYKPPSLVIEICDKGILDKDILSLNWAVQTWGVKCILVTVDDKDYDNALKKLGNNTSLHVMKASDFQKLHSIVVAVGSETLKSLFGVQ